MKNSQWSKLVRDLRSGGVGCALDAWKKMKNLADETNVPELYLLLKDKDIIVRVAAADLISPLEGVRALPDIFQAYSLAFQEEGEDNQGLTTIIIELIENNQEEATPLLLDMLKSNDNETIQFAAWALRYVSSHILPSHLIELINSNTNFGVKSAATASLGSFKGYPEVQELLFILLKDPNSFVREAASIALDNLGYKQNKRIIYL